MRDIDGLLAERVAEIVARHPGGTRRGSGYLVASGRVFTAAHVVAGARMVKVRFDADRATESEYVATIAWAHEGADLAVLTLEGHTGPDGPYVRFGRVGEHDAELHCTAAGFPQFKLRDYPASADSPAQSADDARFRDIEHVRGKCRVLSNRREGTLDLDVTPPAALSDRSVSPWRGMSGAAVFSGTTCVGLVSEHHLADGLGRLAVSRADRWAERLSVEELRRLGDLVGCSLESADLADVVQVRRARVRSAYYKELKRRALPLPVTPGSEDEETMQGDTGHLSDREADLQRLISFCAGEEPYLWLKGDRFAGKTTLVASFVLWALDRPGTGREGEDRLDQVVPVWFFVDELLTGKHDSQAYVRALIEQLSDIAGRPHLQPLDDAVRHREHEELLVEAAAELARRGAVLLLVVDGLDEDVYARDLPGSGGESIASLLPASLPDNVRVLVTSRSDWAAPVAARALQGCTAYEVKQTHASRIIEERAQHDLDEVLLDERARVLAGLLTAAGGGLGSDDLRQLVSARRKSAAGDWYPYRMRLRGALGRILKDAGQGYAFAHTKFSNAVKEALGDNIEQYRDELHEWAGMYEKRGWPADSPLYLLQGYGQMLKEEDPERLALLSANVRRGLRMRIATGSDAAALDELERARAHVAAALPRRFALLAGLAAARSVLGRRNAALHPDVPVAWARLGETDRAVDLARSIRLPAMRAGALANVARVLANTAGEQQLAIARAREAVMLAEGDSGEWARIGPDMRGIEIVNPELGVLVISPDVLVGAGPVGASLDLDDARRKALRSAADALVTAGETGEALTIVDGLRPELLPAGPASETWHEQRRYERDLETWIGAHADAVRAAGAASRPLAVQRLLEAQELAARLPLVREIGVLAQIAAACGQADPLQAKATYDRIQELARQHPQDAEVLAACSLALGEARPEAAADLALEARRTVEAHLRRTALGQPQRPWEPEYDVDAVTGCVRALARTGRWRDAQRLLDAAEQRSAKPRGATAELFTDGRYAIARAQVSEGLGTKAANTLVTAWHEVPSSHWTLRHVLEELSGPVAVDVVSPLVTALKEEATCFPWPFTETLLAVAENLPAEETERARALVQDAEHVLFQAGRQADGEAEDRCRADLAVALAAGGRPGTAEQLLATIEDPETRTRTAWSALDVARAVRITDSSLAAEGTAFYTDMFLNGWWEADMLEALARAGESRATSLLAKRGRGILRDAVQAAVAMALSGRHPAQARRLVRDWDKRLHAEHAGNGAHRAESLAHLLTATGPHPARRVRHIRQRALSDLAAIADRADTRGRHLALLLLSLALLPTDRDQARQRLCEAEECLRAVTQKRRGQIDEVAAFALAQAAAGRIDDALKTGRSLADETARAEVLSLVAGYLVRAAAIPTVTRMRFRTPDYARLAVGLLAHDAPRPDPAGAEEFLTDVLGTDAWHCCLPALAALDPEAVSVVHETLLADQGLEDGSAAGDGGLWADNTDDHSGGPDVPSPAELARALLQLVLSLQQNRQTDTAVTLLAEVTTLFRKHGDRISAAEAQEAAGVLLHMTGQPGKAAAAFGRAAKTYRKFGDAARAAEALRRQADALIQGTARHI
ncbi:trypsin-like peptidase domain-containing protein [Streptomyces sp. NPDC000070]|uniref:trypsin-like peptidase domain-containing protein n=1 Tax=Streptomyces sp. NPDC000070 TaxID=3154240 RepID=UPI00332A565B